MKSYKLAALLSSALIILSAIVWTVFSGKEIPNEITSLTEQGNVDEINLPLIADDGKPEGQLSNLEKNNDKTVSAQDRPNTLDDDGSSDQNDVDQQIKALVNSGNPKAIQTFFATQRKERAERIKEVMETQGDNPLWAESLTAQFTEMQQLFPNFNLLKLEATDCRTSICSLDIRYGSDESVEQYIQAMSHVGQVLGMDAFVHHDAGDGLAVIYLGRDDVKLPGNDSEQQYSMR